MVLYKYIKDKYGQFYIFPGTCIHREFAIANNLLVDTAGFVRLVNGNLHFYGESISLSTKASPVDSERFISQLEL